MFPQTIMSLVVMTPPVVADRGDRPPSICRRQATGLYATLNYSFIAVGTLCSASLIGRLGPLRLELRLHRRRRLRDGAVRHGHRWPSVLIATACMGLCYGPLTPASQQAIAGQGRSPTSLCSCPSARPRCRSAACWPGC